MLDEAGKWLLGIIAAGIAAAVCNIFARDDNRRTVRFAGGLLIAISVILPLRSCAGVDLTGSVSQYAAEIAASLENMKNVDMESVADIIEAQSEKYIVAETEKLGLTCRCEVLALTSPDNTVSPYSVTLWCSGICNEEKENTLKTLISDKLGIPEGRQKYVWEDSQ